MAGVRKRKPRSRKRTAFLKKRAAELYRPNEYGYHKVAADLGVSTSTVRRWLDPAAKQQQLASSRKAKARRTGICVDCGGVTKYHGHGGDGVSKRCASCQTLYLNSPERVAMLTLWPKERIIESIQQWGAEHGEPPRTYDFIGNPDTPGFTTVVKRFGSWNNAIEAAGLEPRLPTDRLLAAGERKKGEDR